MLKRIFLAAFVALVPSLAFGLPPYLGDFQDGSTTHEPSFYFNANAQDPPIAAQISTGSFVLIDAAGTESSGAITWTASVNSRNTGRISIDMGHASIVDGEYSVLVDVGTADSIDVSDMVLFSFSVGRYGTVNDFWGKLGADPTSIPSPTASLGDKINWLFSIATNRKRVTQSLIEWYAADGTTVIGEAALNPNNSTEVDQGATTAP